MSGIEPGRGGARTRFETEPSGSLFCVAGTGGFSTETGGVSGALAGLASAGGGFSAAGPGLSFEGAVTFSDDETFEAGSNGTAGAFGTMTTSLDAASAEGGADPRRGAGTDSRRGLGGGARRRDVVGGTDPGPLAGGPDPGRGMGGTDAGAGVGGGGAPLPGSDAGIGISDVRISGLPGAPGGLLGVPTDTTGTLGILGGGGTLSEFRAAPAPSASSTSEIFGFDVMPA